MATTARGDDPDLRSAVMDMARRVARQRATPVSKKARSLVALTPVRPAATMLGKPVTR